MVDPYPGEGKAGQGRPKTGVGAGVGRVLVSASADGVVAIDEHGRIRVCNPAAEEMFRRPAGELIGSPFGYPIVDGEATEIELRLPDGGIRTVEMRVTSTTVEGERMYVAALRDVTKRRLLERELEAALERQHAVVAVAAHQLRSPLAAIGVLTQVLRDPRSGLTDEQKIDVVDRIADRAARLQALVRKLLTASRIDSGPAPSSQEPVRLLDLILERLVEFDSVHVSCSPDLVALVDREDLSEMLDNYLENAFTHGRPPVEIRATKQAHWIDIRVYDGGPGVPEEFLPLLFQRFSRGPAGARRTEGSGLGLWIVRSLARANGGEARYESAGGEHCFSLRLRNAAGPT